MVTRLDVEADRGACLGRSKVSNFGTGTVGGAVAGYCEVRCSGLADNYVITVHTGAKSCITQGRVEATRIGCLVSGPGGGKRNTGAIQGKCHLTIGNV